MNMRLYVRAAAAAAVLVALAVPAGAAENARDYYTDGMAALADGQLLTAETALRRAVAINPYYADAHLALGRLLLDTGRCTDAVASCSTAVAIAPTDPDAACWLGRAYRVLGDDTAAAAQFAAALALDPGHREARLHEALRRQAAGDARGALQLLRRLEEMAPDYAPLYLVRADIRAARGEARAALADYRRAWTLSPLTAHGEAYLRQLLALAQYAQADTVAQQVLARDPNNRNAHLARAQAALAAGQPLPAATAAALGEAGLTHAYLLGLAARQRGDTTAQLEYFAAAVAADEYDPFARLLYEQVAQAILRADHPQRRALGEWRLRQARRAVERGDEAVTRWHFDRAIALDPQSAPARFTYGRFLQRRGLLQAAQRHLDAAVDLQSRSSLYRDIADENRARRERGYDARAGVRPVPPPPLRVAICLYDDGAGDCLHPLAADLLGEELAAFFIQQPQVTVSARPTGLRELTLAEAEALAGNADLLIYARLTEGEEQGTLTGVVVYRADNRVRPLNLRERGLRWYDELCRRARREAEMLLPRAGEILQLDGAEIIINLGAAHGLQTGDRLQAGAAQVALQVQETGEYLARCAAVHRQDVDRLRRRDRVHQVQDGP